MTTPARLYVHAHLPPRTLASTGARVHVPTSHLPPYVRQPPCARTPVFVPPCTCLRPRPHLCTHAHGSCASAVPLCPLTSTRLLAHAPRTPLAHPVALWAASSDRAPPGCSNAWVMHNASRQLDLWRMLCAQTRSVAQRRARKSARRSRRNSAAAAALHTRRRAHKPRPPHGQRRAGRAQLCSGSPRAQRSRSATTGRLRHSDGKDAPGCTRSLPARPSTRSPARATTPRPWTCSARRSRPCSRDG
jgi:hypothetical protein